tara:strand:- start:13752 stop:14147 length:396 start_codon:yes stop_codon:yes gene_type:complete
MSPYKALAVYLQTRKSAFTSNFEFYPIQASQSEASNNYCIFTNRENETEPVFNGGYESGNMIVQFDFYNTSLADLDSNVEKFKEIFVGQSILLDSTIEMAYADSSNEFDGYDENNKLWVKSLDLSFKYIIK